MPSPQTIITAIYTGLTGRRLRLAAGACCLIFALGGLASFLIPRSLTFSYSGRNCITNPLLLPQLFKPASSASFRAQPHVSLAVAGYPVYAHRTCLELTRPSAAQHSEHLHLRLLGQSLPGQRLTVTPGPLPKLSSQLAAGKAVSTREPLALALDSADQVFDYRLTANGRGSACSKRGQLLTCDLAGLSLVHASRYGFRLERHLHGQAAGTAWQAVLSTVEAVSITGSSIAAGQLVYDQPDQLSLQLSRPASSHGGVSLTASDGANRRELPVSTSLQGDRLIVRFSQPLPRSANLSLSLQHIAAADGGYLAAPYRLDFKTSGGPRVLGINIGSYRVANGTAIRLNFDVALAPSQQLGQYVRAEANGQSLPVTISHSGASLSLTLQRPLPACTGFTVRVLAGLHNIHGVGGGSAWSFASRIVCQQLFTLGTSVQGRAITGYRFGADNPGPGGQIIYVGGTHGDERSSTVILQRWVDYLEANPGIIPAGRGLVIIPTLNPDGYAANRRTNARGVDLNRNFPANNWKQSVIMPDKSVNPNGGGTAPLSEPESKALADYVSARQPRLVLTYHATGGVVIPNDAGDSVVQALSYAAKSSAYYAANAATGTIFEYDTTGAFEDWLHDKRGTAALLIELSAMTSNEFNGHAAALRHTAGL